MGMKGGVYVLNNSAITVRDYIAVQAMSGILANGNVHTFKLDDVAKFAYQMADAMLTASNKKEIIEDAKEKEADSRTKS